ncbi:MAG: MFS transporter [Fusobacteriaceae bacterium]
MRELVNNKISLKTQIFYGAGVSYAIVDQIFAQWILYFYLPPESSELPRILSPILLSLALGISRVVDMVTDPLIGYISDKVNTKWGRRIPFIAFGTIPLTLSTIAFFYPPISSEGTTFLYLAVVGSVFFSFYTIVGGPYNALIPEIGKSSEERLTLSTWQSIFRLLYSGVAMITPGILIKYIGGGNTLVGIRGMVIVLSIVSAVGACFTIFGVNEKKYSLNQVSKIKFEETVKILFKEKFFINYLLGLLFFFVGFNSLRAIMNYYVEDIMGYGKESITIVSILLFGVAGLFFYPITKLSKRYGYRKLMLISLLLLIVLSITLCFVGNILPKQLGFLIFGLLGIPVSGAAFIFPPVMLSEISVKISKKNNQSIEGICFGIQGFFLKLAFMISIIILPIILSFKGNGLVGKIGIYSTSLFSAFSFLVALIFYFKYEE